MPAEEWCLTAVTIIYETHSTSTDNEAGIATGWLQGQLSSTGQIQAHQLGERRRHDTISAVFVSDLQRAVQTAETAFPERNVPIYRDSRLRECNYGEFNGEPVARLVAERVRHIDEPWPGGQSYRQVVEQTAGFLGDIAANWDGQTVLVIAHSANKWALDHLLNGDALEDLVDAPFDWQEGWIYRLTEDWTNR